MGVIRIRISPTDRYQPCIIRISPGGWYGYYKVSCIWKKPVFITKSVNKCLLDGALIRVTDTEI